MPKQFLKVVSPVAVLAIACSLFAEDAKKDSPKSAPPAAAEKPKDGKESKKKRPAPDKEYTPGQVVRIIIDALKNNDAKDGGIATTVDFASPANQEATGPLDRFIPMVKSEAYAPMLNHKSAKYGKVLIDDDEGEAQELVRVTDAKGNVIYYIFRLSKQTEGKFKDCWMTDGVIRVEPRDLPREPKLGDDKSKPDRA
jgi:hypothetical protein